MKFTFSFKTTWGTWWRSRLKHCPTSRKVALSIPDGVIGIFFNMTLLAALCSWDWLSLLQKWVPGIFPGDKGGRCLGLTTLILSCADCLEIRGLSLLEPSRSVQACHGIAVLFKSLYLFQLTHLTKGGFFLANTTSKYKGEVRIWTWERRDIVRFWRLSFEMFGV